MKSTIAPKHATAKKIVTCPQSISLVYEILEVRCLDQIAARLIDARQATAGPALRAAKLSAAMIAPDRGEYC
jgi:hypothetical protein